MTTKQLPPTPGYSVKVTVTHVAKDQPETSRTVYAWDLQDCAMDSKVCDMMPNLADRAHLLGALRTVNNMAADGRINNVSFDLATARGVYRVAVEV